MVVLWMGNWLCWVANLIIQIIARVSFRIGFCWGFVDMVLLVESHTQSLEVSCRRRKLKQIRLYVLFVGELFGTERLLYNPVGCKVTHYMTL